MNGYVMTVGLEVHVELRTRSKIFCSCAISFGASPNTYVCPVCMGLPGAMPRLNRRAVEYAVKAGLALNCAISELSYTDRKNYFYPDLPKAFQISQYDEPLCHGGYVELESGKRIGITRIHVEEDAGKLIHSDEGDTLIDYNRCGTPLIEIVSEPDISSAEEAKEYLKTLRSLLLYTGISDCKMNEGSLRCDVNISARRREDSQLGTRTEIKNLNSFAFVGKAIEAEFARQVALLESGERVERETRRYNASTGKTETLRSKESAEDYRFFREPDLLPIRISSEEIERIAAEIPALPHVRKADYVQRLGLSEYDAGLLSSDMALSDYFTQAAEATAHKKTLTNLLLGEVLRLCTDEDFACPIPPESLGQLATLLAEGDINSTTAKKLIGRMWSDPSILPAETVDKEGLRQIKSTEALLPLIEAAIAANPKAVADYKSGKTNALRSLQGYVMSITGGLAEPKAVEKLMLEALQ